jgi:gamma-glutamylcyclotransferase (GGCT)/AIG2-like uncharacterized protein YtfP
VSTPQSLPLFAYGTLRDREYQRELFGRTFPMQPARVTGFIALSTGGGYLAATRCAGGTISGALVELDRAAYSIADAWEDLSVYSRVAIAAQCGDGRLAPCYMYVQLGAHGRPAMDERLTDRARPEVISDIRRFRLSAAFKHRR